MISARDADLLRVVRLLSAEDVEAMARRLGAAPTRLDVIRACKTAPHVLRDMLFSERACRTPPAAAIPAQTEPPPAPSVPRLAPQAVRPVAARRLDF